MKNVYLSSCFLGCMLLAVLIGCSKDDTPIVNEEGISIDSIGSLGHLAGFGDNDEPPEGIPFELPKGLHFVSRPNHRFDPDLSKLHGNMNTFYVDINVVRDSSWNGGTVEFPEGLVFMNTAPSRIQNGMLMDRVLMSYPPYRTNGGRDTITQYLGVACMNEGKGIPWADNSSEDDRFYPIGKGIHKPSVVTTDKQVLKFLSLLKGKEHLRLTRHYNPQELFEEGYIEPEWMKPYGIIQEMFWKMTDGQGLTKSDIEDLLEAIKK